MDTLNEMNLNKRIKIITREQISIFFISVAIFFSVTSCRINTSEPEQVKGTYNHESIATWQDQKFSMFIHWGLYSIPAGVWDGQKITGYSEQIKGHARIATEDYRKLASAFNPVMWNADSIALLAMKAGMKSIIITAKHHDGFCMFDSEYTLFDLPDATPYKKDVLKELADACKSHGLKFGVYFSLIDWDYHGALPFTSVRNSDSIPPLHHKYNLNQIRELLTNYGEISELWFDMGAPTFQQSKEIALLVKELQPNCLVSGRLWNDQGDFIVMGDNYQPEFKMGVPWQSPASMFRETWGYRSWQERGSREDKINEKIQDLLKVVSAGGNYLLNIGPKTDGGVVPFEKQVLEGIGEWLAKYGESVYGTKESSVPKQDWGYTTLKPGKLYLQIVNYPDNNRLTIRGVDADIVKVYPLSGAELSLNSRISNAGCEIDLTEEIVRDKYVTVIVVEYKSELLFTPVNSLEPDDDGGFFLNPDNAEAYHSYSGHDYYSSKPTIVKMKWYLLNKSRKSFVVRISFSDGENIGGLKLSINGEAYLISGMGSESVSGSNSGGNSGISSKSSSTITPESSSENNAEANSKGDSEVGSRKHIIRKVRLKTDRINEIELCAEDQINPHKGLGVDSLSIVIK